MHGADVMSKFKLTLDRNEKISIFVATVELAKLSMRKDYVSLRFIKSKIK